jgi:hypothetical protein
LYTYIFDAHIFDLYPLIYIGDQLQSSSKLQPSVAFGSQAPSAGGGFGSQTPSSGGFGSQTPSSGAFGSQAPAASGAFGSQASSSGAFGPKTPSTGGGLSSLCSTLYVILFLVMNIFF